MDGKSVEDPQYQDWVLWAADHGLCIDPTEEYWQSKRRWSCGSWFQNDIAFISLYRGREVKRKPHSLLGGDGVERGEGVVYAAASRVFLTTTRRAISFS
jgi:hypothetical protein